MSCAWGIAVFVAAAADVKWSAQQRELLRLAEAARASNAAELARGGALVAVVKSTAAGLSAPMHEATVHCRWRGDRFYSEMTVYAPVEGRPMPADPAEKAKLQRLQKSPEADEPDFVARILYDGNRYWIYSPRGPTPAGHLIILRTREELDGKLHCELADQRPQYRWRRHPVFGDWDEYLLSEARPNPNLVGRELERRDHRITCRRLFRIDRGGAVEEGFAEATIDLDLRGAVVGVRAGGKNGKPFGRERSRSSGNFVWEKLESGACVLRSYEFNSEIAGHGVRTEYLLKEFSTMVPDAGEFVEARLRVRAGARVDDQIAGRTYTYKARDVTQADLDAAIEKSKAARRP